MRMFLAIRSVLFLFLIPGTVTVYIPIQILRNPGHLVAPALSTGSVLAVCVFLAGAAVLLRCVWDFFSAGRGTLAPFDPPTRLVASGLYRFTRNPMYNGVVLVLAAEAWLFRSVALLEYAILMFTVFNLAVFLYEEPMLESQFGESYRTYRRAVPRWGFTTRPFHRGCRNTLRPNGSYASANSGRNRTIP